MDLKPQFESAVNRYINGLPKHLYSQAEIEAAMLSGMMLVANFLSANEGHPQITPQLFAKELAEYGKSKY